MAMFKDIDITADMIREKFPAVAEALAADAAAPQQEITLDSVRSDYPDIAAALIEEGRAAAKADATEAAAAERDRVLKIQALAVAGYEDVIASAVSDPSMTVNDVKIALFDAQQERRASAAEQHRADGEALGKAVAELSGKTDESADDGASAESVLEKAGKQVRGED